MKKKKMNIKERFREEKYLDDKLAKYIWKNEVNVQKIAIYDAKVNEKGYPLFNSSNPRILINDRLLSIK